MSYNGKVLVVDDDLFNLTVVGDELSSLGYSVVTAFNGKDAIEIAQDSRPDVILLDVVMPVMDGYEVCKRLKELEATKYIPVVMLTALKDTESKYKGLEAGAIEFINKPPDMVELGIRLKNVIELKEYHDFLRDNNEILERKVQRKTRELRESFIDTIYRLTIAAEHKERHMASHLKRVSHYTALLARCLGYTEEEAETMFFASPMHDIGKIGIPDEILLKPGKLTDEEFEMMKAHTNIGGKILAQSDSEYLKSAAKFAVHHHENWDGTGYPNGLRGEEIPIEGRIMLMVDRYDAMRCPRPYKDSFNHETTVRFLTEGHERTSPSHFDPIVFEAFKDNMRQFSEIYEEHRDI